MLLRKRSDRLHALRLRDPKLQIRRAAQDHELDLAVILAKGSVGQIVSCSCVASPSARAALHAECSYGPEGPRQRHGLLPQALLPLRVVPCPRRRFLRVLQAVCPAARIPGAAWEVGGDGARRWRVTFLSPAVSEVPVPVVRRRPRVRALFRVPVLRGGGDESALGRPVFSCRPIFLRGLQRDVLSPVLEGLGFTWRKSGWVSAVTERRLRTPLS